MSFRQASKWTFAQGFNFWGWILLVYLLIQPPVSRLNLGEMGYCLGAIWTIPQVGVRKNWNFLVEAALYSLSFIFGLIALRKDPINGFQTFIAWWLLIFGGLGALLVVGSVLSGRKDWLYREEEK